MNWLLKQNMEQHISRVTQYSFWSKTNNTNKKAGKGESNKNERVIQKTEKKPGKPGRADTGNTDEPTKTERKTLTETHRGWFTNQNTKWEYKLQNKTGNNFIKSKHHESCLACFKVTYFSTVRLLMNKWMNEWMMKEKSAILSHTHTVANITQTSRYFAFVWDYFTLGINTRLMLFFCGIEFK